MDRERRREREGGRWGDREREGKREKEGIWGDREKERKT